VIKKLYNTLEKPYFSKYGSLVQKLIALNILINILSFSLPYVVEMSQPFRSFLDIINIITVVLFIVELVLRYAVIGEDPNYKGIKGKLKYTFKFYTLIDIISILPFFLLFLDFNIAVLRIIRLVRFIRIFKLFRLKKLLKKVFNIYSFATANLWLQSFILISMSSLLIYLFSYGYNNSIRESALVFLDPPQIAELDSSFHIVLGIFELIIGLFVGGSLISIITSALEQIVNSINSGYFTAKESNHIVIINQNSKLDFIFDEINKYYEGEEDEESIVILLETLQVEEFKKELIQYTHLDITVIAGNTLQWSSYERVNLNKAQKMILLLSEEQKINENEKIAKFITSHTNFSNKRLSFVIETEQFEYSDEIYDYIFQSLPNHYTLVNNSDLIAKILNRSVVNYNYFKVYSELLSFDGNEFYTVDYLDIFDKPLSFKDASLQLSQTVLIGIVRENKVLLNPTLTTELQKEDKLLLIMEDRLAYKLLPERIEDKSILMQLSKPKLKEKRNIVIIGEHTDIKKHNITQFLVNESIEQFQIYVKDDNNYMDTVLWDSLINSEIDVIIFNLEDEYEFTLSLYLNSVYRDKPEFLSKIVNILHDPIIAKLLTSNQNTNSMILSQKLIGEFISQSLFNPNTYAIFDEITQSKGNELYILDKDQYSSLYMLEYNELKSILLNNRMIYIGALINTEFYFYSENIGNADKIIVLAEGEE